MPPTAPVSSPPPRPPAEPAPATAASRHPPFEEHPHAEQHPPPRPSHPPVDGAHYPPGPVWSVPPAPPSWLRVQWDNPARRPDMIGAALAASRSRRAEPPAASVARLRPRNPSRRPSIHVLVSPGSLSRGKDNEAGAAVLAAVSALRARWIRAVRACRWGSEENCAARASPFRPPRRPPRKAPPVVVVGLPLRELGFALRRWLRQPGLG